MLTRFISESAWFTPEYSYSYDKTVDLKNSLYFVAGNMNVNSPPFLEKTKDISNNNYSLMYLTDKKSLNDVCGIKMEEVPGMSQDYPSLLGVLAPQNLVRDDSRFIECQPLYLFNNRFSVNYATFNNSFSGLSGGSIILSSAFPRISAFEIGFSINGQPPIYRTNLSKFPFVVTGRLSSIANTFSKFITAFNFVDFLSGSSREVSRQQTVKLILSSYSSNLSGDSLEGYSIAFGNTTLVSPSAYKKLCLRFNVNGRSFYPPEFNVEELVTVPALTSFNRTFTSSAIVRELTAVFDLNRYPDSPLARAFGVGNISFDNKGLELTIFNRISGSTTFVPYTVDAFNTFKNIFKIEKLQDGFDAGFSLQFEPKKDRTTISLDLPETYYSSNSLFSLTGISDFNLTLNTFNIEETYKPNFVRLFGKNNNAFLDFNIYSGKKVIITHTRKSRKIYLISDDLKKQLYFIDESRINDSNIELAKFDFVYDKETNRFIVYRSIESSFYAITMFGNDLVYQKILSLSEISPNSIFYLFRYKDINIDYGRNLWASYDKDINYNSLTIDQDYSYDVTNNYLYHAEYNNIESKIDVNFLPLKNQLNEFYKQNRKINDVYFRDYHTIFSGDNTELGTHSISLGYIANTREYILRAGEVTYFHIPYNESYKRIGINETSLVKNGAIAGSSPLFSDKIWKKIGDYKYNSNLGNSQNEQTGQWLCAWLSGADFGGNGIWMDRYYNPDVITQVEAIKITNNIVYIPSYINRENPPGITDTVSTLTFEPGVWYAYSHIGKNDAVKIIQTINQDLVQEGIINMTINNEGEYEMNGRNTGYISLKNFKTPFNNFALSFFGYSDDWTQLKGSQILGNYLDTGFGIFNYNEVNPLNFYFNRDKITIYNNEQVPILKITQPPALSGNVIGVLRRNYYENFHIILDNFNILEYNLMGTLVDVVSSDNIVKKNVLSVNNNLNTGIILYQDLSYTKIDLKTNITSYFPSSSAVTNVFFNEPNQNTISVYLDPFDKIYAVNGRQPFLREDKLYFIDNYETKHIRVFDTVNGGDKLYIDTKTLETSGTQQKLTVSYTNSDQNILEFPFKAFNLKSLSGASITLTSPTAHIPDNDQYHLAFSIYKEPYLFKYSYSDPNITETILLTSTPPKNPIYVDLHGNYWYDHTVLEVPDELNNEFFGKKVYYAENNLLFVSDPNYQEKLGATTNSYGRVFVYTLTGGRVYYLNSYELGPRRQRFRFGYDATNLEALCSFPLSSYIMFTVGSEVYSAFGTNEKSLTGFSLAFAPWGIGNVYYVQPQNDYTKIYNTFTEPVTSTATLIRQLTGAFNQSIIPNPDSPGNFLTLSAFFDFYLISSTSNSFEMEAICKYPGAVYGTPTIESVNPDLNGGFFTSNIYEDGKDGTGQNGELFGWEVTSLPSIIKVPYSDRIVAISSPNWMKGSNSIGKVSLYFNTLYTQNLINTDIENPDRITNFTTFTASNIECPVVIDGNRFGYSLASVFDTNSFQNLKLLVGAPNDNNTINPTSSAILYNINFTLAQSLCSSIDFTLTDTSSADFGRKVDMYDIFGGLSGLYVGVGAPKFNTGSVRSAGKVRIYKNSTPNFATNLPVSLSSIQEIFPSGNYYKFGQSFKLHKDLLAVASVSSFKSGPGNMIADIYRLTPYDQLSGRYVLVNTVTAEFLNNYGPVSALNVSVDLDDTNLILGAWYGDLNPYGFEDGKVVIWYHKQNNFYTMYEKRYSNENPLVFKTFFGNSVSLKKDRLLTGTTFIYNTGNSMAWAVSAIANAITTQTNKNSGYDGKIDNFNNNSFKFTATGRLSAAAKESAVVNNVLTTDYTLSTFNIFIDVENNIGSTLHYSGDIINYSFDRDEKTIVFTDYDRVKIYDQLGDYESVIKLTDKNLTSNLSCIRFSIANTVKNRNLKQDYSMLAIDSFKQMYLVNYDLEIDRLSYELIDTLPNNYLLGANQFIDYPIFSNVTKNNYDINNNVLMISDVRLRNPEPSLTFKLRLNNRLDYEETTILSPAILGETLSKGWHHFVIVFDSIRGLYRGYVDMQKIFEQKVSPNKYSFSNVLVNNLLVGAAPYYNNINFNQFFKSTSTSFYADGIKIDKVKFYNRSINEPEIKCLYYEKFEPKNIEFQLTYGDRNYIDTISRVSRFKIPGRKSPFINININDSLITDKGLQKYYETLLISELKEMLPTYVKINNIQWNFNKPAKEKIVQGDINIGNTLTNSGGFE
jgi:hypothetical protein